VLLFYYLGVILVITLAPFRFSTPEDLRVLLSGGWFDVVANVLLFVPLGFLYPLTRPSQQSPSPAQVWMLGVLLSGLIETAQLFEGERYTSLIDVFANGAGAGAGASLQRLAAQRIHLNARLIGRLSLELPLMGIVYLLVPLLWLTSMAAGAEPLGMLPLLFVGLFGGRVLAALQHHHFGPAGALSPRGVAGVAAGWMLVGAFPTLASQPILGGAAILAVSAAAGAEAARLGRSQRTPERRFEVRTLRGAAPWLGAYFAAMMLVPLARCASPWTWWVGFSGRVEALGTAEQLYLLESVAALTVVGYLLAEIRSRRELAFRAVAPRLILECGLLSAAVEGVRGFQVAWGASLAQLLLLWGAGLLGGWIYHLQRDHVREIASQGSGAAVRGSSFTTGRLTT
jgi:glycopeptide antibiotics resistance protein